MNDRLSLNPAPQGGRISWNTHYLLTRSAQGSLGNGFLDSEVPVTRLEDFIEAAGKPLRDVMDGYAALLAKKTGVARDSTRRMPDIRTTADLIAALRLNPEKPILYTKALRPEETPADAPHDPSRHGPPGAPYVEAAIGEPMSVRQVLCVYADEPDWGMDQDLFPIESYRLGEQPFGSVLGKSSQACFHMAFFHEVPLLVKLFPRVEKTFLDVRVKVFLALARLALDSRVDYWAWRFAAWATHYLQDLTQPYHAKALPFSGWAVLSRFLRNPRVSEFTSRNKNLLMNRHVIFESVVHLMLNEAAKKRANHAFFTALDGGGASVEGKLRDVLWASSKVAAKKALLVNRALELVLNDPRLVDPEYFVGYDPAYPLEQKLADASENRPDVLRELTDLVSGCLVQTGKVTRYVVREVAG